MNENKVLDAAVRDHVADVRAYCLGLPGGRFPDTVLLVDEEGDVVGVRDRTPEDVTSG